MQVALWNCTLEIVIYNNGMKNKYSNKYLIETGIGLQDVDKLKNSSYFLNESNRYIKGEISLDELDRIINSYYKKLIRSLLRYLNVFLMIHLPLQ